VSQLKKSKNERVLGRGIREIAVGTDTPIQSRHEIGAKIKKFPRKILQLRGAFAKHHRNESCSVERPEYRR
jgi:hypothetical protein